MASQSLNPDLVHPASHTIMHYTRISVYRDRRATSKFDLRRWPSLADGYLSPLRESPIPTSSCERGALKRFSVNTRIAICPGLYVALGKKEPTRSFPYCSNLERTESERARGRKRKKERERHTRKKRNEKTSMTRAMRDRRRKE